MSAALALCTMYRNHAHYLREWVEFHMLVGAERFFLYDNGSTDDHLEVLAPYLDEGTVVLHDWPMYPGGLHQAFANCIEVHRHDARWIAFLDIDEFLFSPTGKLVPEVLAEYEDLPGIAVNRLAFGTSGHRTMPPGLVIENYVRRVRTSRQVKSIVDPTRVVRCIGAHGFEYEGGAPTVDELRRPINKRALMESFSAQRLRINHYVTKSEEEYAEKFTMPRPDTGEAREPHPDLARRFRLLDEQEDHDIQAYLPALREAMAARERGRGSAREPTGPNKG